MDHGHWWKLQPNQEQHHTTWYCMSLHMFVGCVACISWYDRYPTPYDTAQCILQGRPAVPEQCHLSWRLRGSILMSTACVSLPARYRCQHFINEEVCMHLHMHVQLGTFALRTLHRKIIVLAILSIVWYVLLPHTHRIRGNQPSGHIRQPAGQSKQSTPPCSRVSGIAPNARISSSLPKFADSDLGCWREVLSLQLWISTVRVALLRSTEVWHITNIHGWSMDTTHKACSRPMVNRTIACGVTVHHAHLIYTPTRVKSLSSTIWQQRRQELKQRLRPGLWNSCGECPGGCC